MDDGSGTESRRNISRRFSGKERAMTAGMKEIMITNRNNMFQKFEVLKTNRNKRYRYHEFLEGVRSLNEAVKNHWKIKSFLYDKNRLSDWAAGMLREVGTKENYCLTAELMRQLSGKEDTSELMAVIEMREDALRDVSLSEVPFLVLFDQPGKSGHADPFLRCAGGGHAPFDGTRGGPV